MDLCSLISQNPEKITSLNVEAIIRAGLRRFTDMLSTLWNALATYYIRLGNTEKVIVCIFDGLLFSLFRAMC